MTAVKRRQKIIDAALTLFSEHGFRGTTTRELAAAVGVSEPVLYQHFKTKSDLYTAIIESECEHSVVTLSEVQKLMERNDDRGVFMLLGRSILKWHFDDPRFVKLLLQSALERHEMSDLFYETHVVRIDQIIEGYLKNRMRQRRFRKANPRVIARAFVGMFAHLGLIESVFRPGSLKSEPEEMVASLVDTFLQGIVVEKSKDNK